MQKSIKSHDESFKFPLFLWKTYLWITELKYPKTPFSETVWKVNEVLCGKEPFFTPSSQMSTYTTNPKALLKIN